MNSAHAIHKVLPPMRVEGLAPLSQNINTYVVCCPVPRSQSRTEVSPNIGKVVRDTADYRVITAFNRMLGIDERNWVIDLAIHVVPTEYRLKNHVKRRPLVVRDPNSLPIAADVLGEREHKRGCVELRQY